MAETTTSRGLKVGCPKCGEPGAVMVSLMDTDFFYCNECEDDFDRSDVESLLASAENWRKVLAWLDTAPTGGE